MDDLRDEAGGNPAFVIPFPTIDAPGTDDGEIHKKEPWGPGRIEPVAPERRVSSQPDPIVINDHSVTCEDTWKNSDEM